MIIYIWKFSNNSNKNHIYKIEFEKKKYFCFYFLNLLIIVKKIFFEKLNITINDIKFLSLNQLIYINNIFPSFKKTNLKNIYDILFINSYIYN